MSTGSYENTGASSEYSAIVVFKPILIVAFREIGFVMRAARLVAIQCTKRDHACELEHVRELPSVRHGLRRPEIRIVDRDAV